MNKTYSKVVFTNRQPDITTAIKLNMLRDDLSAGISGVGGGGTGGVLVNPGTWTAFSFSPGWSETSTARYRIQTAGTFSTIFCEGIVAYVSGAASLAFSFPTGVMPSVQRGCVLAGYDSSGDTELYQATVSIAGAVNITRMARQNFSWPSATNGNVYLDNLTFAL